MHPDNLDNALFVTILIGLLLSVVNLIVTLWEGRSRQLAEIKARANLRDLYQRTYKSGRRLVSIARIGKAERRKPPTNGQDRPDGLPPAD